MNPLSQLADNPALLEAVKSLILGYFSLEDLTLQADNEFLGQMTRARLDGRERVTAAFKEIESKRSVPVRPMGPNPAR